MPNDGRDENTPVEVPFAKFEGPTDARLKGKIVDPRFSEMDPRLGGIEHDSDRPVLPADVSDRTLLLAFKRMAEQNANMAADAIHARSRTNDLLEVVNARLKTLPTTSPGYPKGYRTLVVVVGVLSVVNVIDLAHRLLTWLHP